MRENRVIGERKITVVQSLVSNGYRSTTQTHRYGAGAVDLKQEREKFFDEMEEEKDGGEKGRKGKAHSCERCCCEDIMVKYSCKFGDLRVAKYSEDEAFEAMSIRSECCREMIKNGYMKNNNHEFGVKEDYKEREVEEVEIVELMKAELSKEEEFITIASRNWKQISSFYIENIPPHTSSSDLRSIFSKFKGLIDVFIANKFAKNGKRFGFVKFKDNVEERALQEIWIGSYNLRINMQRFGRDGKKMNVFQEERKSSMDYNNNTCNDTKINNIERKRDQQQPSQRCRYVKKLIGENDNEKSRSYMEVLKGKHEQESMVQKSGGVKIRKVGEVHELVVEKKENLWLSNSAIGYLKDNFMDSDDVLDIEICLQCSIAVLGHKKLLLSFESRYTMETSLRNHKENLNQWFQKVKTWENEERRNERVAWIRCSNIPLRGWNNDNFRKIAARFCVLIKIDPLTETKKLLTMARILIQSSYSGAIDESCNFMIQGELVKIQVKEELEKEVQIFKDYRKIMGNDQVEESVELVDEDTIESNLSIS